MKPYVIDRVENDAGNVVKAFKPSAYGKLLEESEADILKELMISVVEDGTVTKLKGLNYTVAGKTGSAEFGTNKGDSHAWFVGYANAKDTTSIAIAVVVEGAGNGSTVGVPIAKSVFDTYFK